MNGMVYGWNIDYNTNIITQLEILRPPIEFDPIPDALGSSLAFMDPWLAVGADFTPGIPGSKTPVGAVHFWKKQPNQDQFLWDHRVVMAPPSLWSNSLLGRTIEFIGPTWMAVGAPAATPAIGGRNEAGAVTFWQLMGENQQWTPSMTIYGDEESYQLGWAVRRVSPRAVVVGAIGAQPSGALFFMRMADRTWVIDPYLTIRAPPGVPLHCGFGFHIAVSDYWMVVGARTQSSSIWLYRRGSADGLLFSFAQQIDSTAEGFGRFGLAFSPPNFLAVSVLDAFHVLTLDSSSGANRSSVLWTHLYEWPTPTGESGASLSGCANGVFLMGTPGLNGATGAATLNSAGPCVATTPPANDNGLYVKYGLIAAGAVLVLILAGVGVYFFVRWRRNRTAQYNASVLDSWEDDPIPDNMRWSEAL